MSLMSNLPPSIPSTKLFLPTMSIKSWVNGSAIATIVGLNSLLTLSPALAQSGPNRAPRNTYPEGVASAFVTNCVQSALSQGAPDGIDPEVFPAIMEGMCTCMMWQFQDRYTIAEFEALVRGIQAQDRDAARQMNDVVGACIPRRQP